jgi:hypothetical protein
LGVCDGDYCADLEAEVSNSHCVIICNLYFGIRLFY